MKTIDELIKCAEREVVMREAVYPGRVKAGKMTQEKADHEIDCMNEIAALLRSKESSK